MGKSKNKLRKNAEKRSVEVNNIMDLENADYTVVELTPYQFRINNAVDIYPTNKKWFNLKIKQWGKYETLWREIDKLISK